jgi:hypothetical protein
MLLSLDHLWKINFLNVRAATAETVAKGGNKLYVAVDTNTIPTERGEALNHCADTLRFLTQKYNFCLILYACIADHTPWTNWAKKSGIQFNYINENPEIQGVAYIQKPYLDIIIDKRAGFQLGFWDRMKMLFERASMELDAPPAIQHKQIPVAKPVTTGYTRTNTKTFNAYDSTNKIETGDGVITESGSQIVHRGTDKYNIKPSQDLTKRTRRSLNGPSKILNIGEDDWEDPN